MPMVWTELMKVKINPSSSPLEGGGQMVLLFYNPLPLGNKMVAFCSQKNQDLAYAQEAFQENMMALICQIPEYPYPEQVELRVYNYNQIIARTDFMFYQRTVQMPPPSDMILQILSSQLQSHFPGGGSNGMGGSNGGRANGSGDQMTGYGGYIPSSMYQLLLGACRLGCEPLVHCLLSSPIMEELTQDQIKEAYECSLSNGHSSLSDFLNELGDLHQMTPIAPPMSRFITRDGTAPSEQKHVPGYYDLLDELQRGGETPQARAQTVLWQLLEAMKERAGLGSDHQGDKEEETNEEETPPDDDVTTPEDVTTPIINIIPNLQDDDLAVQMSKASLSPRRRLSSSAFKLTRQTNSISDEDDELRPMDSSLKSPVPMHSRESWAEVDDVVPDLVSHKKKHPFTQQSDADSAIDSFDEDSYMYSYVSSDVQRRRSSLLLPAEMFGQQNESILIRLNPDVGVEVANSFQWEGSITVTEDYPPNNQDKKILCKGDRIIQVGDKSVRGMTAVEFSEFFQAEATAGTVIKVLPSVPMATQQQSIDNVSISQQKVLRKMPSEPLITDTSLRSRINQLISLRSPSTERKVSLSRTKTTGCYPIKIIGGKSVGVFISDVRSDVTQQIFQGDEIIEVNGVSIRGMTLHDANQMIQTGSESLSLLVVENKTKFSNVREQVEIDSMYLRSLVDHKPSSNRDMALKKGSLLRVINMCSLPNYWVAWSIDDTTGNETQLKRIMPPSVAKRHFGCDAYERVERKECSFNRPLCVSGPDSDRVAKLIAESRSDFSLCESVEQILAVCSKGDGHPVMSINEPMTLKTLKALQPMVFQTPLDAASLAQQAEFAVTSVDLFLAGESCSDYAQQVVKETKTLQHMPIWKPIGVI